MHSQINQFEDHIMNEKINREKNALPTYILDSSRNIRYKRRAFLGKGAFGRCFEIANTENGNVYAGKIVSKEILRKCGMKEKVVQEISIHRKLNHNHVVGFYRYFEDDANVYIVLELCRKRSMAELHKRRQYLTDPEVKYYSKQILSGVEYLHGNKIIHRDLKLGNLFISDKIEVKIGDFGLATTIEDGERKKTMCGTPNYIAPEILEKKGHGCEVDIWSIGCIIFSLLVGKPPFECPTIKETYHRIRHCNYSIPITMNKHAAKMIRRIFVNDPSKRPTSSDLMQDEFFSEGFIPQSLPTSCLVMAPKFNAIDQYLGSKRKPLTQLNAPNLPVCVKKLAGTETWEQSERLTAEMFPSSEAFNFMSTLKLQLLSVLDSKPLEKDRILMDEAEDPAAQPIIWISCWVDYSEKYGFGYKLSDNSMGVMFTDGTRLVLLANEKTMQYTENDGSERHFSINEYDKSLRKKVRLLRRFQQYMGMLTRTGGSIPVLESDSFVRLPLLCDWMRYDRAVVMLLSNGTLQINFFPDHSKIILCPLMGAVTFIDKRELYWTYRLKLIEQYGCSMDLAWRLQYAVRKINDLLKCRK